MITMISSREIKKKSFHLYIFFPPVSLSGYDRNDMNPLLKVSPSLMEALSLWIMTCDEWTPFPQSRLLSSQVPRLTDSLTALCPIPSSLISLPALMSDDATDRLPFGTVIKISVC